MSNVRISQHKQKLKQEKHERPMRTNVERFGVALLEQVFRLRVVAVA